MCDKFGSYDGFHLFEYYDSNISSNYFTFDMYTYIPEHYTKFVSPKFKIVIGCKDKRVSGAFTINELYGYHYMLKKNIIDNLATHQKSIASDKKYTDGFSFKCGRDNNLYTTIMYHYLLDKPCIRFMFGIKEQMVFDTDKVYLPLLEVTCLYKVLGQAIDNYCTLAQNVSMMNMWNKNNQDVIDKCNQMIDAVGKIKVQTVTQTPTIEIDESKLKTNSFSPEITVESESESISETSAVDMLVNGVESEVSCDIDKNTEQYELDEFLKDNVDNQVLDLPENVPNTKTEIKKENVFENKILNGEFKNLDKIIKNCANSPAPLQAFVDVVQSTSGIDLYNGISDVDKYAVNYVCNTTLKRSICAYIQNKIPFPKSVNPIILDVNCDKTKNYSDVMAFLLMSYIYTNKVKSICSDKLENEVDNKSFLSYCLKAITRPFVFTYFDSVDCQCHADIVGDLYIDLFKKDFFKSFEDEIYQNYHISIKVDKTYFVDEALRILESVVKVRSKLTLKNSFNPKFMKLSYEDFNIEGFKYSKDVLNKICVIENGFILGKIDQVLKQKINCTDDIPETILLKYGLKTKKFDNNVIVRYVQSKYPKFADMEQIKKINENVSDIIDTVDITKYPLDVLKCLYFWGSVDKRTITYDSFVSMINNSTLTESELISMIYKGDYKTDNDFFNSLSLIN